MSSFSVVPVRTQICVTIPTVIPPEATLSAPSSFEYHLCAWLMSHELFQNLNRTGDWGSQCYIIETAFEEDEVAFRIREWICLRGIRLCRVQQHLPGRRSNRRDFDRNPHRLVRDQIMRVDQQGWLNNFASIYQVVSTIVIIIVLCATTTRVSGSLVSRSITTAPGWITTTVKQGAFNLRRCSLLCGWISAWLTLTSLLFFWPFSYPVDDVNMTPSLL